MSSLNDDQVRRKITELLIVRISGFSQDNYRQYPKWEMDNDNLENLLENGLGGVILWGGSAREIRSRCKKLQKLANKKLLVCADIEEGLGQRFHGGTQLIPPMGLSDLYQKEPNNAKYLAKSYGKCTARQAKLCGINFILGPVLDVNNNSNNPVINIRAWGEEPNTVAELACSFQTGVAQEGVLSCAKHFPGHGDTIFDSHLKMPTLEHDLNRLNEIELIPFKKAIKYNVDSVMTSHLKLNNIDPVYPTSLSYELTTNLLRKKLGFNGLIITDALIMSAISKSYSSGEAAVLALEAGADLILMPEDPNEAIDAIIKAIKTGRIPISRLEESLQRKQTALRKISAYQTPNYLVSDQNEFECETDNDRNLATDLITLTVKIRNKNTIRASFNGINLIRVENSLNCPLTMQQAPAIILPESSGYKALICDRNSISPWRNDINEPLSLDRIGDGPILLQLFIRGNPFQALNNDKEPWVAAVKQLQKKQLLAGLIVYGSPYIWEEISTVIQKDIPAAFSYGQTLEVQKTLLSRLLGRNENMNQSVNQQQKIFTD